MSQLDKVAENKGLALIVDDNAVNVRLLEKILAPMDGVTSVSTQDPAEAETLFELCRPDIVLLDLHMEPFDGVELMRRLRARVPERSYVPFVVLTADATSGSRDRALVEGATDFLVKPFDAVEVQLRVSNLLMIRRLHEVVEQERIDAETRLRQHEERIRTSTQRANDLFSQVSALIEEGSLIPYFQPIVEAHSRQTVGFEALSRFTVTPQRGPEEWFALAHEVGLGHALEELAILSALGSMSWIPPEMGLGVNVSPGCLLQDQFLSCFDGVDGHRITLEITEHEHVRDHALLARRMSELRDAGFTFAIDDTGAGYSGLSRILTLKPEWIKLDLDLTRGVDADPARRALARSLVFFAQEIGASTVAEGVETESQMEALVEAGITHCQGYLLGHPAPASDCAESLGG